MQADQRARGVDPALRNGASSWGPDFSFRKLRARQQVSDSAPRSPGESSSQFQSIGSKVNLATATVLLRRGIRKLSEIEAEQVALEQRRQVRISSGVVVDTMASAPVCIVLIHYPRAGQELAKGPSIVKAFGAVSRTAMLTPTNKMIRPIRPPKVSSPKRRQREDRNKLPRQPDRRPSQRQHIGR